MASNGVPVGNKRKKAELTAEHRKQLFYTLYSHHQRGALPVGIFKQISNDLPVAPRTVSAHWKSLRAKAEQHVANGGSLHNLPLSFFATNKANGALNASKYSPDEVAAALKEIPFSKRQTMRATANELGLPLASFQAMKKKNEVIRHSSNLCLLYTSPSPRDQRGSRMPSSA